MGELVKGQERGGVFSYCNFPGHSRLYSLSIPTVRKCFLMSKHSPAAIEDWYLSKYGNQLTTTSLYAKKI